MIAKDKIVLDSFALLAYFQDEQGASEVEGLIKKAKARTMVLKLCAINWGEIYYSIVRSKGFEAGQQYLVLIEQLPIQIVDVDRELIREAAFLKAQYPLSYADCFVAALSKREQCSLLTGDKEFKVLPETISVCFL